MDEEPATPDARKERLLQRRRRLERRLAEAALERFGWGAAALEPLRLGEGFTQVLRVSTGRGERFVLKLYSPPPPEGGGAPADAVEAGERHGFGHQQVRLAPELREPRKL